MTDESEPQMHETIPHKDAADDPYKDVTKPTELAQEAQRIYMDMNSTVDQRCMAMLTLQTFWTGYEINRVSDFLETLDFQQVVVPMTPPPGRDPKSML